MSREIKFRAWDTKKKKMFLWDTHVHSWPAWQLSGFYRDKDNKIVVTQYTGLKDSKGTEIYEGDILERQECGTLYQIIWDNNMSRYRMKCLTDNVFLYREPFGHTWEVIGNIYENPELIKEKED